MIDLNQSKALAIHDCGGRLFESIYAAPVQAPNSVFRQVAIFDSAEKKLAKATSDLLVSLNDWPTMPETVRTIAEELQAKLDRMDAGQSPESTVSDR